MDWLIPLFTDTDSVAHIALLYSIVIAAGVYMGKVKIAGISLGVTFVLFAGIVAGHFGFTAPKEILTFMQDFGLMLFVFMIGLQVGPGFFESFRKGGLELNLMSIAIIVLNVSFMFACYFLFFDTSDVTNLPMMVGTLYGAVTNTPGLGAANEALQSVYGETTAPAIANGYACAYPLGVLGIIGATLLLRKLCHISLEKEEDELAKAEEVEDPNVKPRIIHLRVDNMYVAGRPLRQIKEFLNRDIVCSRILHKGQVSIPDRDTTFELGDELMVVCSEADEEAIKAFIGPEIKAEWNEQLEEQPMVSKRVIVTNPSLTGKTVGKLNLRGLYGVNVTRIHRQGIELLARPSLHLRVGDRLMVVGPKDHVERVANMVGNSERRLNAPNIATIFVGIMIGLLFGSLPLAIPGMPTPLRLGLAGGPLIIAILIGRFGYRLRMVTYTTTSANMMLREIGLVLFLASVGIKAGDGFIETVVGSNGWKYVVTGFLITTLPILIVGCYARLRHHVNYFTLSGMVAGTYTDPPALAYADGICQREAPSIGYSTVYPLSMFLRILIAQLLILFCCTAA
ncbi:MAG: putative transporter [Bacteroidaceae bacterium]|nr:putative transporter [Bacteroidaceae bacterium]